MEIKVYISKQILFHASNNQQEYLMTIKHKIIVHKGR